MTASKDELATNSADREAEMVRAHFFLKMNPKATVAISADNTTVYFRAGKGAVLSVTDEKFADMTDEEIDQAIATRMAEMRKQHEECKH